MVDVFAASEIHCTKLDLIMKQLYTDLERGSHQNNFSEVHRFRT